MCTNFGAFGGQLGVVRGHIVELEGPKGPFGTGQSSCMCRSAGRAVSRRACPGGGGGSVGTPTYIPQNDPHDTLIILNTHKWGKIFFQKKLPINSGSHQPRSDPEAGSGSKSFFVLFRHF